MESTALINREVSAAPVSDIGVSTQRNTISAPSSAAAYEVVKRSRREARPLQLLRQADQVRKGGREADKRHPQLGCAEPLDDALRPRARLPRHRVEIGPLLATERNRDPMLATSASTSQPCSARHADVTSPTYPVPTTAIRVMLCPRWMSPCYIPGLA